MLSFIAKATRTVALVGESVVAWNIYRQAEAQRRIAGQGDDRGHDRAGHHHRHHRAAHQMHRRQLENRFDQRTAQAGAIQQGRARCMGTTG